MCAVRNSVGNQKRDVHATRIWLYVGNQVNITNYLSTVSHQVENQGGYYIRSFTAIARPTSGDKLVMNVGCEGVKGEGSSWEPLSLVFHDEQAMPQK